MRTLAITQNITVDGSIGMLGDWFDPQGQGGADSSDLLDELHRQASETDQTTDATGISEHLNRVRKYVVFLDHERPGMAELRGHFG